MLSEKPTISVLTPVYNGAGYIERCYYVLQKQTFTDWEWIVVDDGSTDGTSDIVKQFKDLRIRVVQYERNRGRGYARKCSLEAARGEWVAIWDSDDLYFPDRLEKVNQARIEGFDYCCSYALTVDQELRIKGVRGFWSVSRGLAPLFVHPTLACRLDLARSIGYDPIYHTGEDATMIFTLSNNYRGQFIADALTIYAEDHEVNLQKALDCNISQLSQLKQMYAQSKLGIDRIGFGNLQLRWVTKIMILRAMRIAPGLYPRLTGLRSKGEKAPYWELSEERKEYLQHLRARFSR